MIPTRNFVHWPIFLVLFFITIPPVFSQQNQYDKDQLTSEFHAQRRAELRNLMPPNSCAVLFSNPVRNRSNDVDFLYSQDPDFYYLTGLTEPNSVLILFQSPVTISGVSTNEVIFVQDRDPKSESWEGKRIGKEGVIKSLGFSSVFINKEFSDVTPDFTAFDKILVKLPEDISEGVSRKGSLNWMVNSFNKKVKDAEKEYQSGLLLKMLSTLREVKQQPELILMQKAIDATLAGFNEACKAIEPGMTEYQAQAIVEYYFKKNGSEYPGYPSIAGSGENSCILHYETNRKPLETGDMLVMDMGAEYHGYSADVTRTYPVNGTFSPEQKAIYEIVLEAQEAGIQKVRSGNQFYDPHKAAAAVIAKGLIKLGIIKEELEVMKYFPHGTSHYLGLEVHDAGNYQPLKPGNVITVEPGIYIPAGSPCDKKYWNIGVRIEDDVLVTENEPVVMSVKLPKTVSEIEKIMSEKSPFNDLK